MFYYHLYALTTHSWLNWVDEDDWRKARKVPGVQAKDLIPNFGMIGNCGLRKVQVHHAWRNLAGEGGDEITTSFWT